eukprot:gene9608-13888_t
MAVFYTFTGRQRYLVDQGYSYQVKELGATGMAGSQPSEFQREFEAAGKEKPFCYTKASEVEALLTQVLHSKFGDGDGGGGGDGDQVASHDDEGAGAGAGAGSVAGAGGCGI